MTSRSRHLVIFLLKPEVTTFESALTEIGRERLSRNELQSQLPFEGVLYFRRSVVNRPSWMTFVSEGIVEPLPEVLGQHAAAILFVKVGMERNSRILAFTFGYSRHFLDVDAIESNFGLKAALNILNHESLRVVDIQAIEEGTIHTRRQLSQISPVTAFGLDISRDLLRAVTGRTMGEEFGSWATGADSLALSGVRLEFSQLADLGGRLISAYPSDRYREAFGWIDHVRILPENTQIVGQLDSQLLDSIHARDYARMHLAPPALLAWERTPDFSYNVDALRESSFADLDIRQFVEAIPLDGLSAIDLRKKYKIIVRYDEVEEMAWPVYRCLVFEADHNEHTYVLCGGRWYQVARELVTSVNDYLATITRCGLSLPCAVAGQSEAAYNQAAATGREDLLLLDAQLVKLPGVAGSIEICDLFSAQGHFVHVKKWARSSTLGHLFNQGFVSAKLFKLDSRFRQALLDRIPATHEIMRTLVSTNESPQPGRYEVVYAVITGNVRDWPSGFPFFSKLCLKQACEQLQMAGYRVSTLKIRET